VPATLLQAVTTGQFNVSASFNTNGALESAKHSVWPRSQESSSTRDIDLTSHSGLPSQIKHVLNCQTGAEAGASGTLAFSSGITFQAQWGFLHLRSATAIAHVSENASLVGNASAGATCHLSPTDIFPKPVTLPRIEVQIGPVPIVFLPKVLLNVSGTASTEVNLTAGVSQVLTASAGIHYADGRYSKVSSLKNSFSFIKPTVTGTGNIQVAVGPEIQLLLYGLAGTDINIYPYLRLQADTSQHPWWTLSGGVNAGGGLTAPDLDLHHGDPHIISFSKELAHAETPSPRTWTATEAPVPADAASNPKATLGGVSCPSTSFCVAGGEYLDQSGNASGLLLTWSGGSWKAARAPLPANAASTQDEVTVTGMSCPSASQCVAVGHYASKAGHDPGMLLTWSGGSWKAIQAPMPGNATDSGAFLDGVTCPTTSECIATGVYPDKTGHSDGLLLTWSGGVWKATEAPLPANASTTPEWADSEVVSLSCSSVSECVAGGFYMDASNNTVGLLLTWSGGTWKAAEAPLPANSAQTGQHGIVGEASCPSISLCIAGGSYTDQSGNTQGMLLSWSGGSWTAAEAPLPTNAARTGQNLYGEVNHVTCPSISLCVGDGDYADTSGYEHGLLLTGPA
jgi:hypothetical protein